MYNIRTTVISPGAVATELTETITDPQVAAGVRQVYKRAIPGDSFARAVVFATSQPPEVDANEIPHFSGLLRTPFKKSDPERHAVETLHFRVERAGLCWRRRCAKFPAW